MSGSLIIDARHRLRWHQRLVSDASTALMWAVWLWLWSPALRSFAWLSDLGIRSYPAVMKLLASGQAFGLEGYVVALFGTSGTLLVWNRLPASKVRAPEVQSLRDYARHFEVPEHELQASRCASICVVHHDESGRIVRLESRDACGAAEAMVA
jgi:poly-beta-1,6-N-acetyl-D-glucosamine biosynthesis protein PgaD